jgi:hypothetical protein
MDDLKNFKEKQINDYISHNLDFENPDKISSNTIRTELRNLLGEEPGIKLNYRKDTMINEIDGEKETKKIEVLESITIIFTYEKAIPDGIGGMIQIPVPVEKEFIIS